MTIQFSQLPIGARFEFRGHRYQKLALSMAADEQRWGNVFHHETPVVPEIEPGVAVPPESAGASPAAAAPHSG